MPLLYVALEFCPEFIVTDWARILEPDAKDVINETAIEDEVILPPAKKILAPERSEEMPIPVPENWYHHV